MGIKMLKNILSMKKKLACIVLVFTLMVGGMPANASKIETTEDKIAEITQKILHDENGEMFNDYSVEDVQFVMDHDAEAADKILKYLDEIAIPVYAPEDQPLVSSESKTADEPEHFSVKKDLTDGTVETIYEDFDSSSQELQTEYEPGEYESSIMPPMYMRASSWNEYDPQNYASTRSIYKLFIVRKGTTYYGSAFQIAANYLGTAGHCVYLRGEGGTAIGWAESILCVPAWRTSDPYQPYGNASALSFQAGGNWVNNGNNTYDNGDDWGVIKLNKNMNIGYMGKRNVNDESKLKNKTVRAAGYPGSGNPMKVASCTVQSIGTRKVEVDFQFIAGMSGGPITDTDNYIIGIVRGTSGSNGVFIKFDDWIYNKMCSY